VTWARPLALALLAALASAAPRPARAGEDDAGVSIHLGGAHFEVSDQVTPEQIGLALYPGAQRRSKHADGDSGSVRLDIGGGQDRLRLLLASFRSTDALSAVAAFYRRELGTRGPVTECAGTGQPQKARRAHRGGLELHGLDGIDGIDDCSGSGSKGSLVLVVRENKERLLVSLKPAAEGTELVLMRLQLPTEE
jgi:hypothetical protein